MKELALAGAIGALSGSRTMLGPALVARHVLPASAAGLVTTMALGELVADKSARLGNRTDPGQLVARVAMGAVAAAGQAGRRHKIRAALVGAAGALAAAYGFFHVRRLATNRFGVPNVVAGFVEDTIVLGAAARLAAAWTDKNDRQRPSE